VDEEVGTRWPRSLIFSLNKRLSECEDKKKMDVPQALFPSSPLSVGVESMQICHELIFIEEVHELSTMKFDSVD
jgi:hypothetical protein